MALEMLAKSSHPMKFTPQTFQSCAQRRRGGFTITEVAVITGILGILLAAILGLVSQGSRYMQDIRGNAYTAQVLQEKLEDIRLLSWVNVTNLPTSYSVTFTNPYATVSVCTVTVYTVGCTNRFYTGAQPAQNLWQVTLTATWPSRSAQGVRTNSLTTLIAEGGLNKYIQ